MLTTNERAPGTKVRLTGAFLRSTGQIAGGEGQRTWLLVECKCALCAPKRPQPGIPVCVAVDELAADQDQYDAADRPRWRHVLATNLQRVGRPVRLLEEP